MRYLAVLFLFSLVFSCYYAQPAPLVYWYNHPVQPNETVLVFGANLQYATIFMCNANGKDCEQPTILDSWDSSVKFLFPPTATPGAYLFEVCAKSNCSSTLYGLNVPEVWWVSSELGKDSVPGGRVQIFGKSLSFFEGGCVPGDMPSYNTGTTVILTNTAGNYTITNISATCYDLQFTLPDDFPLGDYSISVLNSLSTIAAKTHRDGAPLVLHVVPVPAEPTTTFDVRAYFGGNLSAAVAAANNATGGGIVYVSAGNPIYMGDQEVITLNDNVYLIGDGADGVTDVVWKNNSAVPKAALITTLGRFAIANIGLYAPTPSAQMIHVTYNSTGRISGIWAERTSVSDIQTVFQIDGYNVVVEYSYFVHAGNCSYAGWPRNCGFWLNSTSHVRLLNNMFELHCQGYAGFGVDHILMQGNQIFSSSNITSDGSGFSTLGTKMFEEKVTLLRNYHQGDFDAPVRYETYTSDGPGGAYFGQVSPQSTTGALSLLSSATIGNTNYLGACVLVLNGTGAGQIRRIISYNTTNFALDSPLTISLDNTSYVSIIPYRAETLLVGNHWANGTVVQVFGAAFYTLIADNLQSYMKPSKQIHPAGIASWGLDYYGVQPSLFVEILDNTLVGADGITALATTGDKFVGPYLRAHVIRGNTLSQSTNIDIQGSSSDFVIEFNDITGLLSNETAILVASTTDHILIR